MTVPQDSNTGIVDTAPEEIQDVELQTLHLQTSALQGQARALTKMRYSRTDFLDDTQGKTFADVVNDPKQPVDFVLDFFSDAERQRRMEEFELHHDRSPLAGVVRELESQP